MGQCHSQPQVNNQQFPLLIQRLEVTFMPNCHLLLACLPQPCFKSFWKFSKSSAARRITAQNVVWASITSVKPYPPARFQLNMVGELSALSWCEPPVVVHTRRAKKGSA